MVTPTTGHRRERAAAGSLAAALVLILLGGLFLLQNFGALPGLGNWWALFILIPALRAAGMAWALYRDAGHRLTAGARRALLSAAFFVFLTAMFLFNLSWGRFWPVFLILAGLEALASRGGEARQED